jgi:hypothetical protein
VKRKCKEKNKFKHLKLKKKPVPMKIGKRCVSKDGPGSVRPYHMTKL